MHTTVLALHIHHHLRGPRVDYFGIALAAFVAGAGIPGPGEAVVIGAGIAASRGKLDLLGLLGSAWLGAAVGGVAGWAAGHAGGRRVVLAGRWLRAPRERILEHGREIFERYGVLAVYFVPAWAAGLNAMRLSRFAPINAVCALLWALQFGLGAYLLGPSVTDLADDIGIAGTVVLAVAIVVTVITARRRLRRRRSGTLSGG